MLARTLSLCGSMLVAALTGAAHGQDAIVFSEAPGPERELSSLESECGGRKVRVDIVNRRYEPSLLAGVYVDGIAMDIDSGQFAKLASFLSSTHKAFLVGSTCGTAGQIGVGVQGLKWRPQPGEKDDVLQVFAINY